MRALWLCCETRLEMIDLEVMTLTFGPVVPWWPDQGLGRGQWTSLTTLKAGTGCWPIWHLTTPDHNISITPLATRPNLYNTYIISHIPRLACLLACNVLMYHMTVEHIWLFTWVTVETLLRSCLSFRLTILLCRHEHKSQVHVHSMR